MNEVQEKIKELKEVRNEITALLSALDKMAGKLENPEDSEGYRRLADMLVEAAKKFLSDCLSLQSGKTESEIRAVMEEAMAAFQEKSEEMFAAFKERFGPLIDKSVKELKEKFFSK
jgi:flagellar motor component MotA